MDGTEILTLQLTGSFNLIGERATSEETARHWGDLAFEGANPPGFVLWHAARTIDWGVQCAIRGVEEVGRGLGWAERFPAEFLFGAGIAPESARRVAATVPPGAVAEYVDAVRVASLAWLSEQSDETLDTVPDFRANNERVPGYTDEAVWAEIAGLEGLPAWQVLARPCISHIRVHIGEVDAVLQTLARLPSA